eukprot:TRINITY_DN28236_c1_g1_i2.p1 TRINITY_DN28236_c1_g1~~TRINITY_DN28236_c1_g1_i2.p1  ORF type:complete len:274 (+),score=38.34 TRINITY_DN28236_c1_g1_i2:22-843(+)
MLLWNENQIFQRVFCFPFILFIHLVRNSQYFEMAPNSFCFNFLICMVVLGGFWTFVSCQAGGVSDHLQNVVNIMNTVSQMDSLEGLTSKWTVNPQGGTVRIATKPQGMEADTPGEMWPGKTEPIPSPDNEQAGSSSQYQQSYNQLLTLQGLLQSPATEILEASTPEPEEEENTVDLPMVLTLPPVTNQPPKTQLAQPANSPVPMSSPLPLSLPPLVVDTNGQGVVGGVPSPVTGVSNYTLEQFLGLDNLLEASDKPQQSTPILQLDLNSPHVL